MSNADLGAPPVEGLSGGGTGYGWGDCGIAVSRPGSVDIAKNPASDLFSVWCMPSTATVGHQEPPRALDQLNLLIARNERESAQIALRPKISWACGGAVGHVQVHCRDFVSASGDRLESVSLRRVVPILGVPDALVPVSMPTCQVSLLPGETSALWLSVHVPSSQTPGVYEGEMTFSAVKADAEFSVDEGDKLELRKMVENVAAKMDDTRQNPMELLEEVRQDLQHLLDHPALAHNGKMEIDEESLSLKLKISITVWDFVLPVTPTLPAVFGVSETVIEDRFNVEHGSSGWYNALDRHYQWLLQFRISPYFCRWGDNMRILAYTCPWPADHVKAEEYYSDPRLAAYAVPYAPVLSNSNAVKDLVTREIEILSTKEHWRKSYFYLWDEPLSSDQYDFIRTMSEEIRSIAPNSRILTTYYSGPSDVQYPPGSFEAFIKVPSFLRPHTQIFCTSEWVLGGREDLVKEIVAELQPDQREEWWTYVCMGPSDPHPNWHLGMRGTQHRGVLWRAWKEGGSGFLYWGTNCYEKSLCPAAEIRFRRGLPPGDGVLFYPGEVFTPGSSEPVSSVRLERVLSGLQDLEYLNLYASCFGKPASVALLEKCGVYLGPERYTQDHAAIDAMRTEIYCSCRSSS
ncbi:uncharacterized protein LOC9655857 [Selaginella moellendorffii]|uniref:uncharacterized protein LOC9655857 n=1 Tax=Selaginella moellendorffii TaxID=88036 RepID=UPI000D1C9EFF|nr:uncharacterized protein LOC9655857 [Selaginella moellendorffii]|eukprot:XP_024529573.1 uncharacterized protein LOC9655857 [Selaginella moellendorffii]